MNDFCRKIGANDTNLVNPHGLPDDEHYTTAHDLALISAYALSNEKFANIVQTQRKNISNELSNEKIRVLNNSRFQVQVSRDCMTDLI
jgi:D-alanyl-D-alanine carboxypeptidase (penicillin-binding protein 5/6)